MIITPIKNEHYNCADANIVSVARSAERNFHFLFYNYFYFNYIPKINSLMADNLYLFNNDNLYILSKYHGIETTEIHCNSIEKALDEVQKKVAGGSVVMVMTDVFYCPWAGEGIYQSTHNPHFILVTGYGYNSYECIDSFFTTDKLSLNEGELHLASENYFIFKINNPPRLSKADEYSLLVEGINQYKNENLDSYQYFKHDILAIDVQKERNDCKNISEAPLLRCIKQLEYNRYCYIEVLNSMIYAQDTELYGLIDRMQDVCIQWNKLWALLLKCFMQGDISKKNEALTRHIDAIQIREKHLHVDISSYYAKKMKEMEY